MIRAKLNQAIVVAQNVDGGHGGAVGGTTLSTPNPAAAHVDRILQTRFRWTKVPVYVYV